MKLNKKGAEFTLEQFIQFAIAVIAIIGIVVIIGKVASCGDTRELQAKSLLDNIMKTISELTEDNPKSMDLFAPKSWRIISFDSSHNQNGDYNKPTKFFGKNVLCICKDKECKFCSVTQLPLKDGDNLVNIEIEPSYLIFLKTKDKINLNKQYKLEIEEKSEAEKQQIFSSDNQITTNAGNEITFASEQTYSIIKEYFTKKEWENLIRAEIQQESNGNFKAISSSGAIGLMQLMPQTAKEKGLNVYGDEDGDSCKYPLERDETARQNYANCMRNLIIGKTDLELIALDDRFDKTKNILAGARFLADNIIYLKSIPLGIAAYYAGPVAVQKSCSISNQIMICQGFETAIPRPEEYAQQVMSKADVLNSKTT